jgi:hypothetical protein
MKWIFEREKIYTLKPAMSIPTNFAYIKLCREKYEEAGNQTAERKQNKPRRKQITKESVVFR